MFRKQFTSINLPHLKNCFFSYLVFILNIEIKSSFNPIKTSSVLKVSFTLKRNSKKNIIAIKLTNV